MDSSEEDDGFSGGDAGEGEVDWRDSAESNDNDASEEEWTGFQPEGTADIESASSLISEDDAEADGVQPDTAGTFGYD